MLSALMNGSRLTASELAQIAGLSPQSTSNHLSKLINFRVVTFDRIGRNRFYRLYNRLIAQAIESMMIATYADDSFQERLKPNGFKKICYARTCYDHIAGHIGVEIYEHLFKEKVLIRQGKQIVIGGDGNNWFITNLGIDVSAIEESRRALAIACMDWSEQSYHLSGELGACLLNAMLEKRYIIKSNEARILTVTPSGKDFLQHSLGIGCLGD